MKISVLTPTYNREHILEKLYISLIKNSETNSDFEWIIMDDGSSDNTKKLVSSWIKENKINIKYYYQENSGKMVALNNLVGYASGDIILEVDSDDYLKSDALSIIKKDYEDLNRNKRVYGIVYSKKILNSTSNFKIDSSLENKVVKLFDLHFKYNLDFDMTLTFFKDVRKKYKHILEKNERFITEARMYYEMDRNYEGLLVKCDEITICEYLEDGYSSNIKELFKKYPYGYFKYFEECFLMDFKNIIFNKRLYIIKHYILFGCLTKKKKSFLIKNVKGVFNKVLVTLLVIPGYIKTKNKFNL